MRIGKSGLCFVLAGTAVLFAAENGYNLFQKGLAKERADADLRGAVRIYEQVVRENAKDHKLAAQALFRIGECQQALGDKEASKVYGRILRDYPDQNEIVAQAQARLAAMGSVPAAGSGIVTRQVWTGPKVADLGTVSPDGRYLSFVDWETGDLAVHDLTTGQDRRVTNKGTWRDSPEWATGASATSSDSRHVAYTWTIDKRAGLYELRVTDLVGAGIAKPRSLFRNEDVQWIHPYAWTPDGQWIVVQLGRKDRTAQIGLVSAAGGSLRVLKSIEWRGSSNLALSPDGKFIAFDLPAADGIDKRDIFLLAMDGSRETPLVIHPANDRVLGWSSNGKRLLFASDRTGSVGVWALHVSDGKPEGKPELIKPDMGSAYFRGMSRSGSLYFQTRTESHDIDVASVDLETGKVLSPAAIASGEVMSNNYYPDWSPDGKYLAYVSLGRHTLVIRSLETGQERELKPDLSYFQAPRWAPDSRSLAVDGSDKKGHEGIYRIDAQTGEAAPLVLSEPGVSFGPPAWAPDGKTLYFPGMATLTKEVFMTALDLASGTRREITLAKDVRHTTLSPDGRQVAFGKTDPASKSSSLMVLPVAGGQPTELLRLPDGEIVAPMHWSPDGRFLVFLRMGGPTLSISGLWSLPATGGEPQKIGLPVSGNVASGSSHFRIHPDGQRIAFQSRTGKSELWVMENIVPTLTAKE